LYPPFNVGPPLDERLASLQNRNKTKSKILIQKLLSRTDRDFAFLPSQRIVAARPARRVLPALSAPIAPADRPPAQPVGYANDTKPNLSATPATPIGAVDGVGDRSQNLSMA
jgi:hypothetical protein